MPSDPSAGYVERRYADGCYVRPDAGTDDPDSIVSGLTWDWRATDVPSQYSNGRIEFRTEMTRWSEAYTSTSYNEGSIGESDRDVLLGVEALGGWTFYDDGAFDAALDAGFRFYGSGDLGSRTRYGTSVTTTHNDYRIVDSYDASGWTTVPDGPHIGTADGPGRVIGATPTRREELMNSERTTREYFHTGMTKLEYRIWDLRFGPTVSWQVADRLTISSGVYGLLGLVDASLRTSGNLTGAHYRAKKSVCRGVFGMAFGLSAQFDITENVFLSGGVEYDWWSDAVDLSVGGAKSQIRLSDFSATLGMGITF